MAQTTDGIEILPDEVLEYILSLLPPYGDLHDAMLVCKRWRRSVLNVVRMKMRNLHRAVSECEVRCTNYVPLEGTPTIAKRYSHSAVVHGDSMYVFGGCTTSMTTFNDLWRLDLSRRRWVRPLAMGTYPTPKACSSLVAYKNILVLFGGWTYPPSYPPYQRCYLFNELHVYDTVENRWTVKHPSNSPPPLAGHSVSVIGEWMVVFGGLQTSSDATNPDRDRSNTVWRLNLETWQWFKQPVEAAEGGTPTERVAQTQCILDDDNLLIVGGLSSGVEDVWRLQMAANDVWRWTPITVLGKCYKPASIWTNSGVKVGNKLVLFSKVRRGDLKRHTTPQEDALVVNNCASNDSDSFAASSARIDSANRRLDVDDNVNGRRGSFNNSRRPPGGANEPQINANRTYRRPTIIVAHSPSSTLTLSAFNGQYSATIEPSTGRSSHIRNEDRLARLSGAYDKFRNGLGGENEGQKEAVDPSGNKNTGNGNNGYCLGMYVLDLSRALDETKPSVTWLPPRKLPNAPDESSLYTLVMGKSELILFGGLKNGPYSHDFSINAKTEIYNSMHFISAPNYVI